MDTRTRASIVAIRLAALIVMIASVVRPLESHVVAVLAGRLPARDGGRLRLRLYI